MTTGVNDSSHKTACILCSVNCGLEVEVNDGHFSKIRGDKNHVASEGYTCQKALRLDYYQNGKNRVTNPLRKRPDGTFEKISWDTAIQEVAEKFVSIRNNHGGHSLAYYGGGGQGNHLGGAHGAGAWLAAVGSEYIYTSLAQEKTGGFWVDGKLFGKQTCHPAEDVEHADFLLLIGTNPWQSHGFPRARQVLQELVSDPHRTMVVVDPRRTETASKADVHLQVRPGGDAHLLLAMLGHILQENLHDKNFIEQYTTGFDQLESSLRTIPVEQHARDAGLDPTLVKQVARQYATTKKACVRTDLGLEQSLHSTLNLYLSKLLWLITGHFAREGTNTLHTTFGAFVSHSKDPEEGGTTTKVTGMRKIGGIFPPNILPQEIDTDHPERVRGVLCDSHNPLRTAADTQAYHDAFAKLDVLVVIDVAMTETARMADYILPAHTQFEKLEATFFNLEFPENYFHLRHPVMEAQHNTLPEPEIYRRLLVAMDAFPASFPWLTTIAKIDRRFPRLRLFPLAFMRTLKRNRALRKVIPLLLHETLGRALPKGAQAAAAVWGLSHRFVQTYGEDCVRRAGIKDQGLGIGEALFQKILNSKSGTLISVHQYKDSWHFLKHEDGKIHLAIPLLIEEIHALQPLPKAGDYPLLLMAGERRSYNANTIYREEGWRKQDPDGALRIHPDDAAQYTLVDGGWAECRSNRGSVKVRVLLADEMRPGVVSLPHGYGLQENDESGAVREAGPAINMLTASNYCDELSKTPFHKCVPVRLIPLPSPEIVTGDSANQPITV